MLHTRVSQRYLVYDTAMQGTFWGGEGAPLPTQASPPTFPTSAFFPLQFPGTVKLRSHTVPRLGTNTVLQCAHVTSWGTQLAQSPSFLLGWDELFCIRQG